MAGEADRAILAAKVEALRKVTAIHASLFPEQRAAVADPSNRKAIWTTRRGGKTTAVLADFTCRGLRQANTKFIYIALSRRSAKDIAWPILRDLDRRFNLHATFREADLEMVLPNDSSIKLYGANRPGLAENFYGLKLGGVAIDEAAFFTLPLEPLIKDYLGPALTDLEGVLYLMSVPGHRLAGMFYWLTAEFDYRDVFAGRNPSPRKECPDAARWSVHTWTYKENPHTARQVQAELDQEMKYNPGWRKDQKIIRNYLKAWPSEASNLVYKYHPDRNVYEGQWVARDGDHYVIGIDFGWGDHCAIAAACYRDDAEQLLVLESWREREVLLDRVAEVLRDMLARYPDAAMVGDPANRLLFEEFRRRHDFPIMEAEKAQKVLAIQALNSELVAGRIQVLDPDPESNPLVDEWTSLYWLIRADGHRKEQPGQTNDCSDAMLTLFRHARHYLLGEESPQVDNSRQAMADREEQKMIAALEEQWADQQGDPFDGF